MMSHKFVEAMAMIRQYFNIPADETIVFQLSEDDPDGNLNEFGDPASFDTCYSETDIATIIEHMRRIFHDGRSMILYVMWKGTARWGDLTQHAGEDWLIALTGISGI